MACAVLFHFANASMLPLLGTVLAHGKARESSLLLSFCIEVTQVVVIVFAPWCGRQAERWGRRPLLLLGFTFLPLRGLLFALTTVPALLVIIQILDGLAATIFMIVAPLVVADVTRGTGRFNVAQGAIGTATAAGAAVSTTVTGYVVDRFGDAAGFCGLAAVGLVALVLLVVAMPETREAAGESAAGVGRRRAPAARHHRRRSVTPHPRDRRCLVARRPIDRTNRVQMAALATLGLALLVAAALGTYQASLAKAHAVRDAVPEGAPSAVQYLPGSSAQIGTLREPLMSARRSALRAGFDGEDAPIDAFDRLRSVPGHDDEARRLLAQFWDRKAMLSDDPLSRVLYALQARRRGRRRQPPPHGRIGGRRARTASKGAARRRRDARLV